MTHLTGSGGFPARSVWPWYAWGGDTGYRSRRAPPSGELPEPAFGESSLSVGRRCVACPANQAAPRGAPGRRTGWAYQMGHNHRSLV